MSNCSFEWNIRAECQITITRKDSVSERSSIVPISPDQASNGDL